MQRLGFFFFAFYICFNSIAQEMVFVKGNNKIAPFYIDKFEVSMFEFDRFCTQSGYKSTTIQGDSIPWKYDKEGRKIPFEKFAYIPVTRISVVDMEAYAKWSGKRLPMASEWILAAKSVNSSSPTWFDKNSEKIIQGINNIEVVEKKAYNMRGNVSEIVINDHYNQFASNWSHPYVYIGGNCSGPKYLSRLINIYRNPEEFICQDEMKEISRWFQGFRCVMSVDVSTQVKF